MLIKIIYINIIILFINLYYYSYEFNFYYKSIDFPFLSLKSKSFFNISNYLNHKYQIKDNNFLENSTNNSISIYFLGFNPDKFHDIIINNIITIIKKKYSVNINSENPDYLIFNIFSCEYLNPKYNNSIKIAFYTENQITDFNTADYCIGHSHINYFDRYFKFPVYFIYRFFEFNNMEIEIVRNRTLNSSIRKKFCAAIITNGWWTTDGFRMNFINELNKYKQVDMGGRYKNNVGPVNNKTEFLSSYKFSIAMENTEGDGYVSEKIFDAFLSGTIPIYYGDYMIDEYFNPEAFILIRGEKDMKQKIEYIKEIDNNDELYKKILSQKLFLNKDYIKNKTKEEFINFFYNIFLQTKKKQKELIIIFFKFSEKVDKLK